MLRIGLNSFYQSGISEYIGWDSLRSKWNKCSMKSKSSYWTDGDYITKLDIRFSSMIEYET